MVSSDDLEQAANKPASTEKPAAFPGFAGGEVDEVDSGARGGATRLAGVGRRRIGQYHRRGWWDDSSRTNMEQISIDRKAVCWATRCIAGPARSGIRPRNTARLSHGAAMAAGVAKEISAAPAIRCGSRSNWCGRATGPRLGATTMAARSGRHDRAVKVVFVAVLDGDADDVPGG